MKKPTTRRTKVDIQQSFTIKAPAAQSVLLVGDFTDWQQRPLSMKLLGDGVWSASTTLPPGTHHYRFLVDGEWRDDPECTLRVPNPYGGQNMVRVVPQPQQKPARAGTVPITCLTERQPEWKLRDAVRVATSRPRTVAL